MSRKKISKIEILVFIILILGLGYAFLTQNLLINGSGSIKNATWNIYWDNVQVSDDSVEADTPVIDTGKTTVTYSVNLSKPGDYYEFSVDAVNDGTIPAKISSIENKMNNVEITDLPPYLEYEVSFANGDPIVIDHLLLGSERETYKVKIGYKKDVNASDMPTTEQELSLSFSVTYVQGIDDSPKYMYGLPDISNGGQPIYLNDNISKVGNVYNTPQEVTEATGKDYFLRFKVKNNEIIGLDPGYKYNNEFYYVLRSSDDEYEATIDQLSSNFENSSCSYAGLYSQKLGNDDGYYCTNNELEVGVESGENNYSDRGEASVYVDKYDYCYCYGSDKNTSCQCSTKENIYKYSFSLNEVSNGASLSSIGTYYDTPEEVISATGKNYFLQHEIDDNTVVDTKIRYKYNNHLYYIEETCSNDYAYGYYKARHDLLRLFNDNCIALEDTIVCNADNYRYETGTCSSYFGEESKISETPNDYCVCGPYYCKCNSTGNVTSKYSISSNPVNYNDRINDIGTVYNTPEALISATNRVSFLRHKVVNGIIKETDIGFKYNGNIYYLLVNSYNQYLFSEEALNYIFKIQTGHGSCNYTQTDEDPSVPIYECYPADFNKIILATPAGYNSPVFGTTAVYSSQNNYCYCAQVVDDEYDSDEYYCKCN